MSDRLEVHAFRSSAKLPRDEESQRRIRAMVYQTSEDEDAPFERMIDYWFAAVAWAAYREIELPEDDSGGKQFVDIAQGPEFIGLEPWRIDILNILFLLNQTRFLEDPFDASSVDTTAGRFSTTGLPVGGSDVIKVANRYALAGAMPLWEELTGGELGAKQLAAAASLSNHAQTTATQFAATFAAFASPDLAFTESS